MKTRWLVLAALLAAAAIASANSPPPGLWIHLERYDVALVQLNEPHPVVQPNGQTVTYQQAYLVRLFGRFADSRALAAQLYVGAQPILEHGSFPGGVYFFIYEKSKLDTLAGGDFGVAFGNTTKARSLSVKFEPGRFDLTTVTPLKPALERPAIPPR